MARAIDKRIMLDLIIEAKKTDPETGPFSEWLAEYLVDHLPTLTPPNEPLTIEQLRKMDGEPVWVCYSSGAHQWHITKDIVDYANINAIRWKDGGLESMQDYSKTWLAYRRPPEGEANGE